MYVGDAEEREATESANSAEVRSLFAQARRSGLGPAGPASASTRRVACTNCVFLSYLLQLNMFFRDPLKRVVDDLEHLRSYIHYDYSDIPGMGRVQIEMGRHKLNSLLAEVCNTVRQIATYPDIDETKLREADDLLHDLIYLAYDNPLAMGYVPPFGYDAGILVSDPEQHKPDLGEGTGNVVFGIF